MALALYRVDKTKFVPSQHLSNVAAMVRGKYVSMATCKSLRVPHYFAYQDGTDLLENCFGVLRSMGSGNNFDALQIEECLADAMRVGLVYAKRPEWKKNARRLSSVQFDHLNPTNILRVNEDPVSTMDVSLLTTWLLGSSDATDALRLAVDPAHLEWKGLADNGVFIEQPFGQYVGIGARSVAAGALAFDLNRVSDSENDSLNPENDNASKTSSTSAVLVEKKPILR
jgi:hypothetical protein